MAIMPTTPGPRLDKFLAQWTRAGQSAGAIPADDAAIGMALLSKRPPWFPIQSYSTVLVTNRDVLVTPWVGNMGPFQSSVAAPLHLPRPQPLELSSPAKKTHLTGNKVSLPDPLAEFLGRDIVFVLYGLIAENGFALAHASV